MKVLVLDTSAFIQGYSTSDPSTRLYTTPFVVDEIREELAKIRVENWRQTGKLVVQMPDDASTRHVLDAARKMGEVKALSETDLSIIALTYQLKTTSDVSLVSDDYGVQNLSDELGLNYVGMNTRGIKRRFQWIQYCPGCRKQFDKPQQDNVCPICGTELKRKPRNKTTRRGGE